MKRIIITVLLLLWLFSVPVSADVYGDQLDLSGAESFEKDIPDSAEGFLSGLDINLESNDWINKITTGNIFTVIKDFIAEGGKGPFSAAAAVIALIIIASAFEFFSPENQRNEVTGYIGTLAVSVAALIPAFTVITATTAAIKAGAQFMLSFIPVYTTVIFSSGQPLTASASGGLLLAASEGIVQLSTYIIAPLVGAYLAISISTSVSPLISGAGIADFIKKTANWTLGLIMTVYTGILAIQTTVNSAADGLASKTGRFLIGSFVPIVGGPLSEALTTVQSSVTLLRSSMGIYGVVVLVLTALPVLIELLLWRLSLSLCGSVAGVFGMTSVSSLLRSADAAISFLVGILLICSAAFIISLAVLVAAGG